MATTGVPEGPSVRGPGGGIRRRRLDRRLLVLTIAVAVLGAVFGLAVLPGRSGDLAPALGAGLLAQLAATVVLGRLATRPHLGMAAVALVASALLLADSPWRELLAVEAVPWVPLALAWATVRVVERARSPWQLRLSGLTAVVYIAVGAWASHDGRHGSVFTAALATAVPILGGICASLAQRLNQARRDRVAALARERAAVAERARADERRRLAVEMHDTLGHVLTLLVLHANVLTVTSADPAARTAGEQMSRLGTEGLGRLRHLLRLLDDPDVPEGPGPTARAARAAAAPDPEGPGGPGGAPEHRLEPLVSAARAAGQSVHLTCEGDLEAMPPVIARAVHRVVQEGLTNARKHAPGARVRSA
jgi:signal transduction histidine kinase